jgi:hypothetical protein
MIKKLVAGTISSIILLIIIFSNQIVEKYIIYKLSKWVEKDVVFEEFKFEYPNLIKIKGLEIINSNPVYYNNIFEANIITINIDLKSYLFDKLVIINHLKIENPNFYLELLVKKNVIKDVAENKKKIIFEDNIGIAKKINENLPDKIWPQKKRDKNFLIYKSSIDDGTAFIKISSIKDESRISLSGFEFPNIGNQKGFQHYKDVLKIIFFDIFAREKDLNKRKILKEAYKF